MRSERPSFFTDDTVVPSCRIVLLLAVLHCLFYGCALHRTNLTRHIDIVKNSNLDIIAEHIVENMPEHEDLTIAVIDFEILGDGSMNADKFRYLENRLTNSLIKEAKSNDVDIKIKGHEFVKHILKRYEFELSHPFVEECFQSDDDFDHFYEDDEFVPFGRTYWKDWWF